MTGLTLPGMIELPFWSSGSLISASPARGPEPKRRRSFAIFVSETATVFSAPEASTSESRAAWASNGSAGAETTSPVSSVRRARTRPANSGCVFRPVPTAVPPSGIRPSRPSVELAAGHAVGGRGDPLRLLAVEEAELRVHPRRGRLDAAEPARDGRRDRLARDREVGYRFVRLRTPELLARNTLHPRPSLVRRV